MQENEWGIVYVGIKGLEAFNEVYGFVAGDEVLRFTGMVMGETVDELGTPDDFIGHIGGDDFLIITEKGRVQSIARDLASRFSKEIGTHYDFKARQRGYITVEDDEGNEREVGLMELTMGFITSEDGPFTDIREITEAAANARREGNRS
ncbi:MAG: diguanylate cyclase, partial [Anaerolineae bacterium]|jgi:GGDEF domain-containing protein